MNLLSSVARGGAEGRSVWSFASTQNVANKLRSIAFDGTPAERIARYATIAIVAIGVYLRARGYLFSTIPLWLDEASWAILLITKPLVAHLIRPIGFMALTKLLAVMLSPSEAVLRFLPWAAGMATALMAPALASRLFRSTAARLLFVAILALDPTAIDMAKEFKPYSCALGIHAGMILLALRYCRSGTTRDLVWVLSVAGFSILFTQDAIFAYPGLFLVIGIEAFRGRRSKHLVATASTAVAIVSVVAGLYFLIWSRLNQSKEEVYWGKKYDVFYVPEAAGPNKVEWTLGRYAALVETAGSRTEVWASRRLSKKAMSGLKSLDQATWLALNIAGVVAIARGRRGREALLLVLPLAVLATFNILGFWPFGPFRTNLFTLVYVAGIAAFAFDREAKTIRIYDFAPVALLVLLPLFSFEKTWHRDKEMLSVTEPSRFPDALRELVRLQGEHHGKRERIVTDTYGCEPFRYYTKYHPLSQTLGKQIKRGFILRCSGGKDRAAAVFAATRKALRKDDRVWILATQPDVIEALDNAWPEDLEKVGLSRVGENVHVVVGVKTREEAPEPPPPPEPPAEEKQTPDNDQDDPDVHGK